MVKLHISEGKPRICRAQEGNCPIGGEHFNSTREALEAIAKGYSNSFPEKLRKNTKNSFVRVMDTFYAKAKVAKEQKDYEKQNLYEQLVDQWDASHKGVSSSEALKNFIGRMKFSAEVDGFNRKTYAEAVQTAYEENLQFVTSVTPKNNGTYCGAEVPPENIELFREKFKNYVGDEAFQKLEAAKDARDHGHHYHMTMITPPEMKKIDKSILKTIPQKVTILPAGVGYAEDGDKKAYFLVCSSPEVDEWRKTNGLEPKDLHITMGFENKDVFTRSKGKDSLINGGLI